MKNFLTQYYFQIGTLVIVLGIFYFVEPFVVSGRSMTPLYQDGDILLVERVSYHFRIAKDDILIFRYPRFDKEEIDLKRVIGVPLETVTIGDTEMYLGKEDYFIAGDNRQESTDSRDFGTVQKEHIIGKPFMRFHFNNNQEARN